GLIIIPLDRIGQEQCIKIQRLPGAKSVFINGRTDKTDALAQEIEAGVYTHLIMVQRSRLVGFGPWLATRPSRSASRLWLWMSSIWWHCGGVASVHSMHNSLLRRRLGARIPWFGCSATL